MNTDRLRFDLADLAEEATPVDLRDRALKTSRRLGIQRAIATSVAAVVMLGAATGTAIALAPRTDGAGPTPADTPSQTVGPVPTATDAAPDPTATATQSAAVPNEPAAQVPDMYWYSWVEKRDGKVLPGKLWRKRPGGKWEVLRTGSTKILEYAVPSPDGHLLAWTDTSRSPYRVYVSDIDGSNVRVAGTFGENFVCQKPMWLNERRLVFSYGNERGTFVSVDDRGGDRRVITTDGPCLNIFNATDGKLLYHEDGRIVVMTVDGSKRTYPLRLPAGLEVHELAGVSSDAAKVVVGAHEPNPGECSCGWQLRHFLVDVASGSAVELAPIDPEWRKPSGIGWMKRVVFLPSGAFLAQVNTLPDAGGEPRFRLALYSADGKLLSSSAVPAADTPWGTLVG